MTKRDVPFRVTGLGREQGDRRGADGPESTIGPAGRARASTAERARSVDAAGTPQLPSVEVGLRSPGARAWRCRQRDRKRVQFSRPWSCARACQRRGTRRVPSGAPGRESAGRVTVSPDSVPRRRASTLADAFVGSGPEPARGGPADRRVCQQWRAAGHGATGERPFESGTVDSVSAAMASRTAASGETTSPGTRRACRPGPRDSVEPARRPLGDGLRRPSPPGPSRPQRTWRTSR